MYSNVTSSFDFHDHAAAYATAQQGVIGLTRSTAMEYATNDIRVSYEKQFVGLSASLTAYRNALPIPDKCNISR